MVKTRESTRVLYTLRSGNGRGKNIANRNGNVSTLIGFKANAAVVKNACHLFASATQLQTFCRQSFFSFFKGIVKR